MNRYDDAPQWLESFKSGDFNDIPNPLTWSNGGRLLATLINGYELAGGFAELVAIKEAAWEHHRDHRQWPDDPYCLWLCMFFAFRAGHFSVLPAGAADSSDKQAQALDGLCGAFRIALLAIEEKIRQEFLKNLLRA